MRAEDEGKMALPKTPLRIAYFICKHRRCRWLFALSVQRFVQWGAGESM